MSVPPREKTPPASPTRSGVEPILVSPTLNVDDFIDLNALNDMIEKDNKKSRELSGPKLNKQKHKEKLKNWKLPRQRV